MSSRTLIVLTESQFTCDWRVNLATSIESIKCLSYTDMGQVIQRLTVQTCV